MRKKKEEEEEEEEEEENKKDQKKLQSINQSINHKQFSFKYLPKKFEPV